MSDVVCSRCGVPMPPVCYEHSEAARGYNKDVCQSCVREKNSKRKKRFDQSLKGKEAAKRAKQKLISRDNTAYAGRVAGWAARTARS